MFFKIGVTATLLKKKTPTQSFFCKYCEIFKNSLFNTTPPIAASVSKRLVTFLYSACFAKTDRFKRFKAACRAQI